MLPLSSLPFHRLHKIPQQFILNLQPGILLLIVVYCLVRFGPTFRRRRYLLQLGFWPKPTPALYAVLANAVFSADFPLAPTRRQLIPDFILYACRILFHSLFSWHNNTPWCSSIILHQGAFCLLSVFTGTSSYKGHGQTQYSCGFEPTTMFVTMNISRISKFRILNQN